MTNQTNVPGKVAVDRGARPHVVRVRYYTGSSKPKPKAGDRRTTKMHGLQIRVQCMARDFRTGAPIGRIVRAGRPVFDWRKPIELDPWDYHLLTEAERALLPAVAA